MQNIIHVLNTITTLPNMAWVANSVASSLQYSATWRGVMSTADYFMNSDKLSTDLGNSRDDDEAEKIHEDLERLHSRQTHVMSICNAIISECRAYNRDDRPFDLKAAIRSTIENRPAGIENPIDAMQQKQLDKLYDDMVMQELDITAAQLKTMKAAGEAMDKANLEAKLIRVGSNIERIEEYVTHELGHEHDHELSPSDEIVYLDKISLKLDKLINRELLNAARGSFTRRASAMANVKLLKGCAAQCEEIINRARHAVEGAYGEGEIIMQVATAKRDPMEQISRVPQKRIPSYFCNLADLQVQDSVEEELIKAEEEAEND